MKGSLGSNETPLSWWDIGQQLVISFLPSFFLSFRADINVFPFFLFYFSESSCYQRWWNPDTDRSSWSFRLAKVDGTPIDYIFPWLVSSLTFQSQLWKPLERMSLYCFDIAFDISCLSIYLFLSLALSLYILWFLWRLVVCLSPLLDTSSVQKGREWDQSPICDPPPLVSLLSMALFLLLRLVDCSLALWENP